MSKIEKIEFIYQNGFAIPLYKIEKAPAHGYNDNKFCDEFKGFHGLGSQSPLKLWGKG